MKYIRNIILFLGCCLFAACQNKFDYDPSLPYPELQIGDRWTNKYDSRGLQNGIVKGNYLFVNTINISEGKNYLYCLNLVSEKVEWKNEVDFYASQPVCFSSKQVYYVSYVGNIFSFSLYGKKLWAIKPRLDYSAYKINPANNNLLVSTVANGVYEFDKDTGAQVKSHDNSIWGVTVYSKKK